MKINVEMIHDKKIIMKKLLFLFYLLPTLIFAQPILKPHIGLSSPPQNNDQICNIPVYQGSMDNSGYFEGDTLPDFTLYKTNGDSVRLSNLLMAGKPVLLVGGNYTCPVYRRKINDVNNMCNFYGTQLQVYVIYGVEAHPIVDVSPYSGQIWTTSANQTEGVLFEQPDTYGERLAIIDSMLAHYNIVPEILVDGPCNEWWSHFGPAPNNAYLIDTNGIVFAKHGWFHRSPENMWCDIDSLLGTNSGKCNSVGNTGRFSIKLDSGDSTAHSIPAEVLDIYTTIYNLSTTDNVEITISKYEVNIPTDWETALCTDVCLPSTVNSTDITIPSSDSQSFIFYFYTGDSEDTGYVKIRFVNKNKPDNEVFQTYIGRTEASSGLSETKGPGFKIYPNPANDVIIVKVDNTLLGENYSLIDHSGREVLTAKLNLESTTIPLGKLSSGLYYIQIRNQKSHSILILK